VTDPTIALVELDKDHPGFRDATYRTRRNEIAAVAASYRLDDPVPDIEYTPQEHSVWTAALGNLARFHDRYACREYLAGASVVELPRDEIRQLRQINSVVIPETGFRFWPVAGLVSPRTFLTFLGRSVFLATQYIRHHSAPLYTPEPDVIHELVGHAPLLAHAEVAALHRLFGETAVRMPESRAEALIRVYWYTMEFGLVMEGDQLKAIGAGLLSSYGEMDRFERESEIRRLDLDEVARTPFDTSSYQDVLFVAESSEQLLTELTGWLREFR
jgi:phenylalanine-4-hydroxylase